MASNADRWSRQAMPCPSRVRDLDRYRGILYGLLPGACDLGTKAQQIYLRHEQRGFADRIEDDASGSLALLLGTAWFIT
jgi:hypothetical protein